jgi:hypothetical protein
MLNCGGNVQILILQRTILSRELRPELEMFECFTRVIVEKMESAELGVEGAGIIQINGKMSSPGGEAGGRLRHLAAAAAERRGSRALARGCAGSVRIVVVS